MKLLFRFGAALVLVAVLSLQATAQSQKYKCLLQMANYSGEGAYIVVSLLNSQGNYEKTLAVMGDDKKWYKSLKQWHKFNQKKPSDLSAVTGASISGGNRSIVTFNIDASKINKGYKLRFESAVEDNKYHADDVEVTLSTQGMSEKTEGKGYIRYMQLSLIQ